MRLSVPQSHTSTEEWQSFELRMRRRRAGRCVSRALAALETGSADAAREALDEARALDPGNPELDAVANRLRTSPPAPRVVVAGHQPRGRVQARASSRAAAVAAVLAAVLLAPRPLNPPSPVADSTPATSAVPSESRPILQPNLHPSDAAPFRPIEAEGPSAAPPAMDVPASPLPTNVDESASSVGAKRAASDAPVSAARPVRTIDRPADASAQARPRTSAQPPSPIGTSGLHVTASPSAALARAEPVRPSLPPTLPPAPDPPKTMEALSLSGAPGLLADSQPAVPERVASAASSAAAPPSAPATVPAERVVRAALRRYEAAYSQLDANAAGAVWPSVDRRALERAFSGLSAQQVSLGSCEIRVDGGSATADCSGSARWTPRVGGGTQTAARRWRFELKEERGEWVIAQAIVK